MRTAVSIIIPNYNYGRFLSAAIDSALVQTYPDTEIIVIDDGSTDNSREVISSYGDRITAIFQDNSGQNAACNNGFKSSSGDVVIFLDADDVLLPGCAEKCIAALGTDKIKAQYYLQRVDRNLSPIVGKLPTQDMGSENEILKDMKIAGAYTTPPTSGNAYRRGFLEKVMPAPEFMGERYWWAIDGYLNGIAGLMGGIVFIHETLGLYRVHGANLSDAGTVEDIDKIRLLFMRNYIGGQHLGRWAKKLNIPFDVDAARFNPNVCKQRFLAYRLDPDGHPIPTDTWLFLLLSGLCGAFKVNHIKFKKRIFVFLGFIGIAILPRSILQKMIGSIVTPNR